MLAGSESGSPQDFEVVVLERCPGGYGDDLAGIGAWKSGDARDFARERRAMGRVYMRHRSSTRATRSAEVVAQKRLSVGRAHDLASE